MNEDAINDAIDGIKTQLDTAELGTVYDHIPAKPSFPCVIIAPGERWVAPPDTGPTFGQEELSLDVWLIAPPSTDNRSTQRKLNTNLVTAYNALEDISWLQFDEASPPVPVEYNQVKTLATIITVNTLI
jgi:hypothetical protein